VLTLTGSQISEMALRHQSARCVRTPEKTAEVTLIGAADPSSSSRRRVGC
jgi:hypothetical protein